MSEEEKVIEILVNHPPTSDRYLKPIYAVDKAMGWDTNRTRIFVDRLIKRNLLCAKSRAVEGKPELEWWWERCTQSRSSKP